MLSKCKSEHSARHIPSVNISCFLLGHYYYCPHAAKVGWALTFSQVTSAKAWESSHSNVAVSPSVTSRSCGPRTMVTGASASGRRKTHLSTGVSGGHI